ncbi:MAG: hypothetical protein HYY25_16105 [Candidatus Wallbacteria bacterium]|nr:hypothetical protein [Candidatus Wallbacteria bacterium]
MLSEPAFWHRERGILSRENVSLILRAALERGSDFADLYAEDSVVTALTLQDRKIRDIQYSVVRGVGIRAISGRMVGYAHTGDISERSLVEAARTAGCIATGEPRSVTVELADARYQALSPVLEYPDQAASSRKVDVLRRADESARAFDPKVREVSVFYRDSVQRVLIATSDGRICEDERVRTSLYVSAVAMDHGERQSGSARSGGMRGFELFEVEPAEAIGRRAAEQAVKMLSAGEAPVGQLPVILTNGWGAVLLHEAIGHGIEADFNRRGTSKFTEKLGKPVGSSIVTISDTAVIPNHWGSLNVDDEGGEGHETRLVENGVLVSYMYDRYNSSLMGLAAGGNSRRENYRCTPMPRMTNTVMANGPHTFEEIVASVKKGFYAADFTGGQVDITNGQFVFSVSEGYLVEDGQITSPVKGATLIGDGADVLGKITMVADDFKLSFGGCGKNGQYVPVGLGQPHLLVSSMTVGGTRG